MVERPLCMREVPGSIPGFSRIETFPTHRNNSIVLFFFLFCNSFLLIYRLINRGKFVISRCSKLLYWNHSSLFWHYKKVHDLQSLSPAVEDGEDDGRPWISHKSGDTKSPKESKELPSVHSLSKLDGDIGKFCPAVMGYNLIWLLF